MSTESNMRQTTDGKNPEWTGEFGRDPLPLKGYATLIGVFGAGMAGLLTWAAKNDRLLDEVSFSDLAIMGLGSQKLARMMSKDRVGTVLRKPFTVYDGTEDALPGEAEEHARHEGELRQAIGELVTCPYCSATWSVAAIFGSYLADRKLGRTIGSFLATLSAADMLQSVYHDILSS